jgi:cGMP-dependent protein kinase 1
MFYCKNNEEYIFKQKDEAFCFFIIDKGEANVEIDGKNRKKLEKCDGFGDLALLYNAPRSASIRCVGTCYFWAIDRVTFRKAIEESIMITYDENRAFLNSIPFFSSFPSFFS